MDPLFDPEANCVCLHLRRLSRVVTRRYEEALRPLNLKSFQFSTLVALSSRPAVSQTGLANAFGMDISTLNRNLRPLVTRGAVEIVADEKDARVRLLKITPQGRALYKEALPLWHAAQEDALRLLGPQGWPDIKQATNKLLDRS
ncbi:MAG: MarR family winged helix-turn-helix transcriptional regulator [Pseudomonadota bacterium]